MVSSNLIELRTCTRCKKDIPIADFRPHKYSADGIGYYCSICRNLFRVETYEKHKEIRLKEMKDYRATPTGKIKKKEASWREQGIINIDNSPFLWPNYLEAIEKAKDKFGIIRCEICNTDTPKGRCNSWHVDHNHSTGIFRGILCDRCDKTLGFIKDSIDLLEKLKIFLQRNNF